MALTASTLITAAKRRAFGATGRQKVSNAMLLEELSYQDQLVVQMLSQITPDLLATITGSVVLTDSGNINGYTLDSGIHYRDFTHVDTVNNVYVPINILQRQHQESRPAAPAGMLRTAATAGVFYPIDPRNKRWGTSDDRQWFEPDSSHEIAYSYVALPAALTALSDTLSSPDMAREIFVTALEVRILIASPDLTEAKAARLQLAVTALTAAQGSLRMQAHKFAHPQGQPARSGIGHSDSAWVNSQVNS